MKLCGGPNSYGGIERQATYSTLCHRNTRIATQHQHSQPHRETEKSPQRPALIALCPSNRNARTPQSDQIADNATMKSKLILLIFAALAVAATSAFSFTFWPFPALHPTLPLLDRFLYPKPSASPQFTGRVVKGPPTRRERPSSFVSPVGAQQRLRTQSYNTPVPTCEARNAKSASIHNLIASSGDQLRDVEVTRHYVVNSSAHCRRQHLQHQLLGRSEDGACGSPRCTAAGGRYLHVLAELDEGYRLVRANGTAFLAAHEAFCGGGWMKSMYRGGAVAA